MLMDTRRTEYRSDVGADYGLTWYVAFTKVRQELRACEGLRDAGYQCFLPLVKRAEIPGVHRRRPRYRPLFPRYIFIGLGAHLHYTSSIQDVDGVEKILSANGKWVQVPAGMLVSLMFESGFNLHDEKTPKVKTYRRRRRPRRAPRKMKRDIRRLAQWLDDRRRNMQ